MRHGTHGGPSGIIHGYVRAQGGTGGWVRVCYPRGAHPGECRRDGSVIGMSDEDLARHEVPSSTPIDCKRCLKRLGAAADVIVTRRVVRRRVAAAPQDTL